MKVKIGIDDAARGGGYPPLYLVPETTFEEDLFRKYCDAVSSDYQIAAFYGNNSEQELNILSNAGITIHFNKRENIKGEKI